MKKPTLKRYLRKKKQEEQRPLRITNDTVAEHRERILAGGRRFKYPVQYARHKLVINAILIALGALIILTIVGWWQLYRQQNTSTLLYRVTKVLPLPVASVDGTSVRYSDYLVKYRGSIHLLEQNGLLEKDKDSLQRQLDFYKRSVLDDVERDAYAQKLAKEQNITVSNDEIEKAIDDGRQASNGTISKELYFSSIYESYGYSEDELRSTLQHSILRQKVAYAVDDKARATAAQAKELLQKKGATLQSVAKELGTDTAQYINPGLVSKTNQQDGGLPQIAAAMKIGEISEPVQSTKGDGYYIVRLKAITTSKLDYEYIKIPLTEFEQNFKELVSNHKITEYINVPRQDSVAYRKESIYV